MTAVDATKCPLCNQDNGCLNEQCGGDINKECWCNNPEIQFPATLLDQVPAQGRGTACICRKCVTTFHAANSPKR